MKIKYSLAAILVLSTLNASDNLGTINVESSTIENISIDLKTEASTINTINLNIYLTLSFKLY